MRAAMKVGRESLMTKLRAPLPVSEDKDTDTRTFRLPVKLLKRMKAIADHRGVSLNKLAVPFLDWACDEYEAEYGVPPTDKKK